MKEKKSANLFAILIISLLAYGMASILSLYLHFTFPGFIPLTTSGENKIIPIQDKTFTPVMIKEPKYKESTIKGNTSTSNLTQRNTENYSEIYLRKSTNRHQSFTQQTTK
ncbi:conserved hypothetical protein [Methanothermus fervidus DSM 2088]|uniref:Uncharacterized protein n=1 Tax=Methanothermus fervidus (strain ATCC 43054 / DSM 2088 / JCM 10308 / V24 S) TaxID=523846 RepID=E3GYB5_METFV|nr:hypothetical protein [Methanothermus fervidus]ADP77297.1 conserved hypothetical protein [Methanothermus fervidus DSM 2088]